MLSEKPWRVDLTVFFFGALVLSWNLAGILAWGLHRFEIDGFRDSEDFGFAILASLSFHGLALVLMPFFLRAHGVGFRDVFCRPGMLRSLIAAVLTALIILPVTLLLESACIFLLEHLGRPVEDQVAVKLVMDAKSIFRLVYMGVFAIVFAPIAEEFVFRGLLFSLSKQLGHRRFAWLGVSALFASIHFDVARFLPLFFLGLVLTWLYVKTGNLLASIFAHSLFNTFGFVMILFRDRWEHFFK